MDYPRRIDGPLKAWQSEWSSFAELADRMATAVRTSPLALEALREYASAYRRDLNSHVDGVTVVAIVKLLDHLAVTTGLDPVSTGVTDLFDIIPAVRFAARVALERGEFIAAAHSTLGELYLVSGDQADEKEREEALVHYHIAGEFPAERDILAERLRFLAALGFRPTLVSSALDALAGKPE